MNDDDIITILDRADTTLGVFELLERKIPGRDGEPIIEILVNDDMLMSTINFDSEEELSTSALAMHDGPGPLDVLVGGLGLGYTTRAVLRDPRVAHVTVMDAVPAVIDWMATGRFPLSAQLNVEPRLTVQHSDVYAKMLSPYVGDTPRYDLILIDVDHCPFDRLDEKNEPFYTWHGQRQVIEHLKPNGVLGVWSSQDDLEFADVLEEVYPEFRLHHVTIQDEFIEEGDEIEEVIFLARRSD